MEQRLSIVTVGVDDLAAMRDFYVEKFGWKPEAENKDIVFFKLGGVLLGFFEKEDLARDAQVEPASGVNSKAFSLAHDVRTEEEVDELFAVLESRGGGDRQAPREDVLRGVRGLRGRRRGQPVGHSLQPLYRAGRAGRRRRACGHQAP